MRLNLGGKTTDPVHLTLPCLQICTIHTRFYVLHVHTFPLSEAIALIWFDSDFEDARSEVGNRKAPFFSSWKKTRNECYTCIGNSAIRNKRYSVTQSKVPFTSIFSLLPRFSNAILYLCVCRGGGLGRLGPPDFYPPSPDGEEENLCCDHVQNGYRAAVPGIEVGSTSRRNQAPNESGGSHAGSGKGWLLIHIR